MFDLNQRIAVEPDPVSGHWDLMSLAVLVFMCDQCAFPTTW